MEDAKCDLQRRQARLAVCSFLFYRTRGYDVILCLEQRKAIAVNIQVIRVFTKMREMLLTHKDILLKLEQIEGKIAGHDEDIQLIFEYLKQLLNPPQEPRPRIGFRRPNEKD